MKYIFIGDIHGKVEQVERALAMKGKKVFVGDFIDSYDRTTEQHKECYDLVFDAIDKGEAEAIYGNHELSYILPHTHRCSGWDDERDMLMTHYSQMIQDRFKPFIFIKPNLLITHAGLDKVIWDQEAFSLNNLCQALAEMWPDVASPVHWIGYSRGGRKSVGGIFWNDFHREHTPIPKLKQIFGHTRGKGIRVNKSSTCIDCLDLEHKFLEVEIEEAGEQV